jgi:hypothetical protein
LSLPQRMTETQEIQFVDLIGEGLLGNFQKLGDQIFVGRNGFLISIDEPLLF